MSMTQSLTSNELDDVVSISDYNVEPLKERPSLTPLIKLDSEARSSLYEVLKPICFLIDDLPDRITYSLEKSVNPPTTLTVDEFAAIDLYNQHWPLDEFSFHTMFNRALRDENRAKFVPFYQYFRLFMSALSKLPSISDRVWRYETGYWGDQYQAGTVHVWWGVSSCTDMSQIINNFLNQTIKHTLFSINCKNGKIIQDYSEMPDDIEIILPPGTYLKVKSSFNATPDLCIVNLEEIVPTPEEITRLGPIDHTSDTLVSISQIDSLHVLWIDAHVNESDENKNMQEKLKELFPKRFGIFESADDAIDHIQHKQNHQYLLITSGQIGEQIVPKVNEFLYVKFIIVYCLSRLAHEQLESKYEKVKAVLTETEDLIKKLQELDKEFREERKLIQSRSSKDRKGSFVNMTANETEHGLEILDDLIDEPVMTLEKSLQGVIAIIPELRAYINIAMNNCQHSVDGLTQNESAAIYIYTMEWEEEEACFYRLLNHDLRTLKRDYLKKWFPYLRLFLQALNKLPTYKGTVWRGVRRDLSKTYRVGALGTWWGFASTIPKMSVLESDLDMGQQGPRTIFRIECQNGKSIRNHSQFSNEDEVLLLPSFHFEITNKYTAPNGSQVIVLNEIDPSCDLGEDHAQQDCLGEKNSRPKKNKVASFFNSRFHMHK